MELFIDHAVAVMLCNCVSLTFIGTLTDFF